MIVAINGIGGKMGTLLNDYLLTQKVKVVAFEKVGKSKVDVVIDFSSPSALTSLLKYSTTTKTPLVIATTGYDSKQLAAINLAAKKVAIFKSANMSVGIYLIRKMLKDYTKLLETNYDIEILEKHHNRKVDSPSGTALLLANTISESAAKPKKIITDRSKTKVVRAHEEIGIAAVRAGNIIGEHSVMFASEEDMIEINHIAYSKLMFAKGAYKAAQFILSKKSGLFSMDDIPLGRMK
jgi:4-hydroxy-tetrahydrodipicolinate reductase